MFNLGDVVRDKNSGESGIIAGDTIIKFGIVSHPVQLNDRSIIYIPETNLEKGAIKDKERTSV